MVRRRQNDGIVGERTDVLQQRDDDALLFPDVTLVAAGGGESIKFVKKKHTWALFHIVENAAQILARLAKQAAHKSVAPRGQ